MTLVVTFLMLGLIIVAISWATPEKYWTNTMSLSALAAFTYLDWKSACVLFLLSILTYLTLQYLKFNKLLALGAIAALVAVFVIVKFNKSFEYDYQSKQIVLIGVSFYLFRLIHLAIEVYKRNINGVGFWRWNQFLFFFPVLLIGPIIRYSDFDRELRRRRWDTGLFSQGLERILYGFVKIVFLGSYLFNMVLLVYLQESDISNTTWWYAYLDSFRYAGNAYFQFAGYTDMAIGLSYLMGMRLMDNFHFPFLATSIPDFWKRWHISLSQWCRDYIYMPMASATRLPVLGIILSMLVLGLWHEFSWRYIIWAAVHGVAIVVWQYLDKLTGNAVNKKVKQGISWFFTFNFVIISFGVIKDDTIEQTINTMKILLFLN